MTTDQPVTVEYAKQMRHLGSLPLCFALGACDIGEVTLGSGDRRYITWGRNMTWDEAAKFAETTEFQPCCIGQVQDRTLSRNNYELILPAKHVEKLELVDQKGHWIPCQD